MTTAPAPALKSRITSLDQFRGYTVAGMFLVNYLSYFLACPFVLKHHNTYCSYADTIMPQFFFAVGYSLRLSFGRRTIEQGLGRAYWHVVKRLLGLLIVAFFVAHRGSFHLPHGAQFNWETVKEIGAWHGIWPDAFKREWFQTLTHIAVTSLWILPVIRLGAGWRILYMIISGLLHLGLSAQFNFLWVNGVPPYQPTGIDGGPLGFLSWTIPTMVGTLACDVVMSHRSHLGIFSHLFVWGVILMALGWIASCGTRWYDVREGQPGLEADARFAQNPVFPSKADVDEWWSNLKAREWSKVRAEWPLVPPPHSHDVVGTVPENSTDRPRTEDLSYRYRRWNYWMMSQRAGAISYLTFGAGLSLALYGLFYVLADIVGFRIGVFRTLGTNALFGYVLEDPVEDAVKAFVPRDVPPTVMWISFAVFFFVCWLIIRSLEKRNIYIKL